MSDKKSAFTLLEVVLSVAILGILTTMSFMTFYGYQNKSELDLTTNTIAQVVRRAQILSQSQKSDTAWSIKITDDAFVLFRGTDYDTRDTLYDEVYPIPKSLELQNTLGFNGTCETGTTVTLTIADSLEIIHAPCIDGQYFAVPTASFAALDNSATVIQTDKAGNVSFVNTLEW